MKNKKLILVGIVLIIVIGLLFFLNLENQSQPVREVKVGVIIPLSGDVASLGEKVMRGIEIANKQFDAEDHIRFIYEDGGIEPKKAVTAYQKLFSLNQAHLFIGPFGPDQTLAVAPILKPADLMLAISLCEDRFKPHPQIFCTYPSIPEQVTSAIPIIRSQQIKKLALIVPNSELGLIVEQELKDHQTEGGYEINIVEKIKLGDRDFRTQIAKIKAAGSDALYFGSLPEEGYVLLKQLYDLNFSGPKIAFFDAVEERLKDLGPAAEGVYLPGHISPRFDEGFVEKYQENYKEEPDLYGALGHSIASALIEALRNNNFQEEKLTSHLIDLDTDTAITGFKFTPNRTVSIPVEVLLFKNGKMQQLSF